MRRVGTAILLLVFGPLASAQDVSKVLIPLIVTDRHQRLVSDLKPASPVISERRKPMAEISVLRGLDMPLELGILIDTSNSEREYGGMDEVIARAKDLVNDVARGVQDRVFFLTFADKVQGTGWLKKEQAATVSLNLKMRGGTALYDSLAIACRERMGPRDWTRPTRRMLIVISDGDDNSSHITRDEAVSEALKSGVVIFAVDAGLFGNPRRGARTLEYWAKVSGGEFFGGFTRQEIPKVFSRIKESIEGIYYARYVPPGSNDSVHEVEVRPAPKEKLEISYPRKYLWIQ